MYKVVRTTPCAAYLRAVLSVPKLVTLPDGTTFEAHTGQETVAVSLHSAVYREA